MEQQALGRLQMGHYQAHDEEDYLWMLQTLKGPQDESNLNDCLSGEFSLLDSNGHHKNECRRSGRTGTRKRTSPWDPMFFERRVSREYKRKKNNSRWTAEEVKRLVQGVSKFGTHRWTKLKQNFFEGAIRTPDHLKDKWRNLEKTYKENSSQQTTQLYLEPWLVKLIRKLVVKYPYANKRQRR